MDYQLNNKRDYKMESVSFLLAILSITSCTCLYISLPCGALAIIFGLLSKGGANSMSSRACLSVGLGTAGLVLSIIIITIAMVSMYLHYGSMDAMYNAINQGDYNSLLQDFYK